MTTMTTMIALEGVGKTYGSVTAIKPTSFNVREGEFLTLLGPSGSGKSTILNLISGSAMPTSGRILLAGRDVTRTPAREREIGMVFQNYALMPHLSVFDNVAYPLTIRRIPPAEIKAKVHDVLKRVGLQGFEHRKPRQLSGGQQQRVGIARCIVYSPKIILMDEPLGALDKNMRDQMQEEIKRLHQELGTTIVYVTHDQEEALNLSDRICLMNAGAIAQIGAPEALYYAPENRFTADFIGESNILEASAVGADGLRTTAEGLRVRLASGTAPQGPIEILIRPEKLRSITPDGTGDEPNTVVGTVDFVSFFGGMTKVTVRTDAGKLVFVKGISDKAGAPVHPGDRVAYGWDEGDMVALNGSRSDGKRNRDAE